MPSTTTYSRLAAAGKGDNAATATKSVVVDTSAYDWEGDTTLGSPSCARQARALHKVDEQVGHNKAYDPRSYLLLTETAMAERVAEAVKELRVAGTTIAT